MGNITAITEYIIREFASDVPAAELPEDYDLLANGIIDSLSLLRIIPWAESQFALDLDTVEISPQDFRTVENIDAFIEKTRAATRSAQGSGGRTTA